jgi:IclR family pca regulon transcriptional regulator
MRQFLGIMSSRPPHSSDGSITTNHVTERSRYHTEALARGLAILEQFNERDSWLSLMELATRTGIDKSTALRLVDTLRSLGFLERSSTSRKYRPGLRVLQLGHAALAASNLHDLALPSLEQLASETHETVNMGVLVGGAVLYIVRLKRAELVTANIQVGSTLPAYCTSMGKLLLADLGEAERAKLLESESWASLGPHTIVEPRAFSVELRKIKSRGWAAQDEELAAGLRSVAAPVRDSSARVVAAINVAVPATRVSMDELTRDLLPRLLQSAELISALAGYRR